MRWFFVLEKRNVSGKKTAKKKQYQNQNRQNRWTRAAEYNEFRKEFGENRYHPDAEQSVSDLKITSEDLKNPQILEQKIGVCTSDPNQIDSWVSKIAKFRFFFIFFRSFSHIWCVQKRENIVKIL